jgi:PKD repeat protein
VRFTAEAASPGNGAITYAWSFGDGAAGTGAAASHAYDEAGTYTATVVATHVPTGRTAQSVVQVTVGRPIPRPTVSVLLNFAADGRDSATVTGELPVPAGFTVSGATLTVDLGGIAQTFTFDEKGRASGDAGTARISVRTEGGNVPGQRAPFTATFRGDLAPALADEGLTDTTTNAIVYVPVTLTFGGRTVVHPVELMYSAKAGKKGSAR